MQSKEVRRMISACRYCGQTVVIEDVECKKDAEEQATLQCRCEGAQKYNRALKRRDKARDNIELSMYKVDEAVCEYLKGCVDLVDNRKIGKITIDTGSGIKVSVTKTQKDTIKVTKKISKDVTYDE